jgi:hypothetical protein
LLVRLKTNTQTYVNTSTFLKGKSHLDPEEIVRDRRVAQKRIHLGGMNGLANTFRILKYELPISKVPLTSRIVFVCFAFSNFRNCIVHMSACAFPIHGNSTHMDIEDFQQLCPCNINCSYYFTIKQEHVSQILYSNTYIRASKLKLEATT